MPEITVEYLASQGLNDTFPQRFWSKVKIRGQCWIWTGARASFGHGNIARGHPFIGTISAHVASWIMIRGPIPRGLCVLHNCPERDNPSCVNVEHLWLGTKKDNTIDAVVKGTWKEGHPVCRGEKHSRHILTESDVIEIRRIHSLGLFNQRQLGRMFGVHYATINDIVLMKKWTHI